MNYSVVSTRAIRAFTRCLILCAALSRTEVASGADGNTPSQGLAAKLETTGAIRDGAIGRYVEVASAWHPEAAARLALKTGDPTARQQRVEQSIHLWLACDPDSAKRWLAKINLPDETKQRWLSEKPASQF